MKPSEINTLHPILKAAALGKVDVLKELTVDKPINDLEAINQNGWTALHFASCNGHLPCVQAIVALGFDLSAQTNSGATAVHLAVWKDRQDVLQHLLRCGANPHVTDVPTWKLMALGQSPVVFDSLLQGGRTPLHYACQFASTDCFPLLIQARCEVNKADKDGMTPLLFACDKGCIQIVEVLLQLKCSPTFRDNFKRHALHHACLMGHTELVHTLLHHMKKSQLVESLNATDKAGFTPLALAALKGHADVCHSLLVSGAQYDAPGPLGLAPLHYAAATGQLGVVSVFINFAQRKALNQAAAMCLPGQNPHANAGHESSSRLMQKDLTGWTPLHWAGACSQMAVAQLLLDAGCDPSAMTEDGTLTCKQSSNHPAIAAIMSAGEFDVSSQPEALRPFFMPGGPFFELLKNAKAAASKYSPMLKVSRNQHGNIVETAPSPSSNSMQSKSHVLLQNSEADETGDFEQQNMDASPSFIQTSSTSDMNYPTAQQQYPPTISDIRAPFMPTMSAFPQAPMMPANAAGNFMYPTMPPPVPHMMIRQDFMPVPMPAMDSRTGAMGFYVPGAT